MLNVDYKPFIDDIKRFSPTVKYINDCASTIVKYTDKHQSNIHYEVNKTTGEMIIYLNSAKSFMSTIPSGLEFRQILQLRKPTVNKFHQRVFEFKLKEKIKIN